MELHWVMHAVKIYTFAAYEKYITYFSGVCDNSIPLKFVDHPPMDMYAVVDHDVTMHFKYNGINIHNTWKVNHSHRIDDTQILHNSSNSRKHCDEEYYFELIKVQYSGNFTVYASRGAYNASGLHKTIHLSM